MNNDLISREALIRALENPSDKHYLSKSILDLVFKRIDNALTVDINKWLDPDIDPELALENIRRIVYEQ